jgi:F-type H+-transporting ATPase subunit c
MEPVGLAYIAAGLGAGLVVIGASLGIGKLATSALESMARQPEISGGLRTSMIIAAALIEGFTLFALVVTILLALKEPVKKAEKAPEEKAATEEAAGH